MLLATIARVAGSKDAMPSDFSMAPPEPDEPIEGKDLTSHILGLIGPTAAPGDEFEAPVHDESDS